MIDDLNDELLAPELFFGLIGAVGTDLSVICDLLREALQEVQYGYEEIKLSKLLDLEGADRSDTYNEYLSKMSAGTSLRKLYKRGDALILEALIELWARRRSLAEDISDDVTDLVNDDDEQVPPPPAPIEQQAFVFNSLKHPGEVDTLRKIYGKSFFLIAAYSAREKRAQFLSRRIASSRSIMNSDTCRPDAEFLLEKDRADHGDSLGQNVQKAFPLADVFVNCDDRVGAKDALRRFIRLIFQNTFQTPSREEHAMFLARAAALRSSDLGRQVGAVIMTNSISGSGGGDIIAIGTNEVPKAGGGQYWEGDPNDQRDFIIGSDSNTSMKRNLLRDLMKQLEKDGWFSAEKSENVDAFVDDIFSENSKPSELKSSQLMGLIAYFRAVHAEMACITDAAKRGVSLSGQIMVCTTFPCHECARHIVAAGITKVLYIEPYPKSLTPDLYLDSVKIDQAEINHQSVNFMPFVGVAPRQYLNLFDASAIERKLPDGSVKTWNAKDARPRSSEHPLSYMTRESKRIEFVVKFKDNQGNINQSNIEGSQ